MLIRFLGAAPIHAIAELGYMAGNRGPDDHVTVFPRPNRLFDSSSGANRQLGRLDIIKRHKLRGLVGGHHGFLSDAPSSSVMLRSLAKRCLILSRSEVGWDHCTSLAIRRRHASAGFSIIRVLPILMGLSLPSWISFVSVAGDMPTRIQRPKSARSS